jgi:hypothetical protein
MLLHICIYNTQAAYNNTSEVELEDADVLPIQTSDLSLYPIGTNVAQQFDGADGELVWFEGAVHRFDEEEDLYWVLYSDDDSEEMEAAEVREAVHSYKAHLQEEAVVAEAEIETVTIAPPITSVDVDVTNTPPVVLDNASPAAHTRAADSVHPLSGAVSSELAVAMQAMTAAAEQLAAAATRIEAAVQTQRVQQPQLQLQHQQQHQMLTSQPWLLHRHRQQVLLQQQQQQQQHLAYYQQQQMLYWQQMYNFKQQCRR